MALERILRSSQAASQDVSGNQNVVDQVPASFPPTLSGSAPGGKRSRLPAATQVYVRISVLRLT
jgi:hypothetical protein